MTSTLSSVLAAANLGIGKYGSRIISILNQIHCCDPCILRYLGIRDVRIHKQVVPSRIVPFISKGACSPQIQSSIQSSSPFSKLPASTTVSDEGESNGRPSKRIALEKLEQDKDEQQVPKATTPTPDEPNFEHVHSHCPACLGFLELDFAALAQQTWSAFGPEGYKLNHTTFSISNRLPPQLAIRHQSICRLLNHEILANDKRPKSPKMAIIDGRKREVSQSDSDEDSLPPAIDVKEIVKYIISDALASHSKLKYHVKSPLIIAFEMSHPGTQFDFEFMTRIPHAKFEVTKSQKKGKVIYKGASADRIAKAASLLSFQDYEVNQYCPPPKINSAPIIDSLGFSHEPVFVAGRYLKLQRHISNSPWEIKGKRMTEDSVEELISIHLDPFFGASGHRFSSAGREDSDVLMLGKGRPFYFEILDPHRLGMTQEELTQLQHKINTAANGKIQVRDLQMVPRDDIRILKDSASTKSKSYVCLVKLSEPVSIETITSVSGTKDLPISQRNPTRVPRRADIVRAKVIEDLRIEPIFETEASNTEMTDSLRVHLKTSAGTYVKEFVHSDGGRTVPSLKSLLSVSEAQCVQLDVSEVHLDWPPYLE